MLMKFKINMAVMIEIHSMLITTGNDVVFENRFLICHELNYFMLIYSRNGIVVFDSRFLII